MPIQNYRVAGHDFRIHRAGDQGPVLLLVHGFPMNHAQWHPQLQHFASQCRLIAPDLRGLGGSPITDEHTTVGMDQHADDLVALLDHFKIKEPVIFVGLSMGGYIGWQMVKRHASRLRGLVLCHTRIIADTPAAAAGRHNLAAQLLKENSTKPAEDAFIPKLLGPNAPVTVVDQVRQMARSAAPAGLAANLRGLAVREDATSILPTIRIPTQAISGEHDAISSPDEMRNWAGKIASARFTVISGVGHVSPLEAPDAFNQCLAEFLSWCAGKTSP